MNSTGILRKIDELGRVVLPKELRKSLDIWPGDSLVIYTEENDTIILRKHQPNCIFCSCENNLSNYRDKLICNHCMDNLSKISDPGNSSDGSQHDSLSDIS